MNMNCSCKSSRISSCCSSSSTCNTPSYWPYIRSSNNTAYSSGCAKQSSCGCSGSCGSGCSGNSCKCGGASYTSTNCGCSSQNSSNSFRTASIGGQSYVSIVPAVTEGNGCDGVTIYCPIATSCNTGGIRSGCGTSASSCSSSTSCGCSIRCDSSCYGGCGCLGDCDDDSDDEDCCDCGCDCSNSNDFSNCGCSNCSGYSGCECCEGEIDDCDGYPCDCDCDCGCDCDDDELDYDDDDDDDVECHHHHNDGICESCRQNSRTCSSSYCNCSQNNRSCSQRTCIYLFRTPVIRQLQARTSNYASQLIAKQAARAC